MSEIFIQTFFLYFIVIDPLGNTPLFLSITQNMDTNKKIKIALSATIIASIILLFFACLLYTSPSPRDVEESRMPSSA